MDSSKHITGCYTTNPREVLPPLYIFDSKAASLDNFKVETSWVDGLPSVAGKFGWEKEYTYYSSVAVRKKGSMDESLFQEYVEKIVQG